MEENKAISAGPCCLTENCPDYGQREKGNIRKTGKTEKVVQLMFVALLKAEPLPLGLFVPEPGPVVMPACKKPKSHPAQAVPSASQAAA